MESLMKLIGRTSRCAILFRDEAFYDLGLTGTQHSYILAICKNPGISQVQISKTLLIDKSNVTRQLALLEQSGFITRRQEEGNRRQVAVFPTNKALEAYPRVLSVLGEWNKILTAGLTEEQIEHLVQLMRIALNNAEQATTGNIEDSL